MPKLPSIVLLLPLLACLNLCGQALSKDQKKFLKTNCVTISEDTLLSGANWQAVLPHVKGKKIILLGEFNHGSREVFLARNSLIKYLHEELGIRTILLESGIGELISTDLNKDELTPVEMTYGLFGGWRTSEFAELMAYIQSEKMSVAGFDVQRSGGSFIHVLKKVAGEKNLDTTLYATLEERYGQVNKELSNRKVVYDSVSTKTDQLIRDYQVMLDELSRHTTTGMSQQLQLSIATLRNRITYLSYMLEYAKDKDPNKKWAARDSAMAQNIQWLLEHVYKDEPVIVIGHNFHIARSNDNEEVMGEMLASVYGPDMYSLGVFAEKGSFHNNAGKEQLMVVPDTAALDIKHIIAELQRPVCFIDIPSKRVKGSDWLDEQIIVNDTFIDLNNTNKLVLARHFDGILLIEKVSPPVAN